MRDLQPDKPLQLLSLKAACDQARAAAPDKKVNPALMQVGQWVRSYLMNAHPDLGRTGDVCPFTAQASRMDTIRIGVIEASDAPTIKRAMLDCFHQFNEIPCPRSLRHFRTAVGLPNCDNPEGLAAVRAVQKQLKFYILPRAKMLALFHSKSESPGLWNPQFRPLRAPIPTLVIRYLVVNDAPFVARHPLLLPTYLFNWPLAGLRRLFNHAVSHA